MKTYCISDVHGHYDNLNRFVATLNEDDKVYVLGDVIDKGKETIKCLDLIMHDRRFAMLLGNHEYMMFQFLMADNPYEESLARTQWLGYNSGYDTYGQYEKLSKDKKEEILTYIRNLPLNIPELRINDKTFYLVHSNPKKDVQYHLIDIENDDDLIVSFVWDRVGPGYSFKMDNKIIIAGHTPVQNYNMFYVEEIKPVYDGEDISCAHYIDIDGGLAADLENSRLIALCLDDLTYKLY